jgi:hypothetical protein
MMVFEVGKFYRHTTGLEYSIIGKLETTMWGKTLIAETNSSDLEAVGEDMYATVNFEEISREEWMKNFSK